MSSEIKKAIDSFTRGERFGNYKIKVKIDKNKNAILTYHDFIIAFKTKEGRIFFKKPRLDFNFNISWHAIMNITGLRYAVWNQSVGGIDWPLEHDWIEIIGDRSNAIVNFQNPFDIA